ncbi:UDP-2,3-diacylglucosamine diphosphatase [Microbacter margulisiae]|uniref:UDP-2,3-diacylglucosamine hydrolase n=1 Tax=Microbacter margulisiae TaxID=1350067 RepID=A0A7W5DT16_9PORP|nr:UDP-2,3-diacylglucosamine diphosphatase [Microbacter margulisiae]MBB3188547.1 UDP-2,3-diacylglucosamine hydrolase [Microbacter margulisiae]
MTKKIYFASDAHFGSLLVKDPHEQERKMVRWLDSIRTDADEIFLMGDIFDFWFEYKKVVPKGFVRILGKLADLTDAGIKIHFFTGNHDIWTFGYLEEEIGLIVHHKPEIIERNGKHFFLAHGDRLGDHSLGVRIIQSIFHNRLCQFLFRLLPPRLGLNFGLVWSKSNRLKPKRNGYASFLGENKEILVRFAKEVATTEHIDFFVFGHRHIILDLIIKPNCRVCILGDWITHFSYGVFDGTHFSIEYFEPESNLNPL